jgi:predicted signal transduction protein with EAL and GGDEF domain
MPLRKAMLGLAAGVRLAVDDVGADPSRRAVVVGLVHFAAEVVSQVIAEGIETQAERTTMAELGVTLRRGYLLARPAPAETRSVATQGRDALVQRPSHVVRRFRRSASRPIHPLVAGPASHAG